MLSNTRLKSESIKRLMTVCKHFAQQFNSHRESLYRYVRMAILDMPSLSKVSLLVAVPGIYFITPELSQSGHRRQEKSDVQQPNPINTVNTLS